MTTRSRISISLLAGTTAIGAELAGAIQCGDPVTNGKYTVSLTTRPVMHLGDATGPELKLLRDTYSKWTFILGAVTILRKIPSVNFIGILSTLFIHVNQLWALLQVLLARTPMLGFE